MQKQTLETILEKLKDGSYIETPKSCLCGADDYEVIATEDRYGIPFRTVICKQCGLIYANPYYDDSTLNDFYQNFYRDLYSSGACTDERFNSDVVRGKIIIKNIENVMQKKIERQKVYEIGCGSGALLFAFKNNGCDVFGCDYKTSWSEFGKQKGINIEEGSFQVLEKYGKADIIILSHIIEHIKDPVKFLSEISSLLLKENGILYIILPTIETIARNYSHNLFYYLQNAHAYCFSKNTAKYIIEKSGLSTIHIIEKEGVFVAELMSAKLPQPQINKQEYEKTMQILKRNEQIFKIKRIIFPILTTLSKIKRKILKR